MRSEGKLNGFVSANLSPRAPDGLKGTGLWRLTNVLESLSFLADPPSKTAQLRDKLAASTNQRRSARLAILRVVVDGRRVTYATPT